MKVLLVNTGQYIPLSGYNYPISAFQPAGIAYIANVLLKDNHKVSILDCLVEAYDHEEIRGEDKYIGLCDMEIKKRIKAFSPDVVGITIPFTSQARAGHEMAKLVKDINNKIPVVVGGSYPTTYIEKVLEDDCVDFVVFGEGEITMSVLTKKFESKSRNFQKVDGLAYKDKGIKINKARPLILNLDDYLMAWDLLPMDKYFQAAYEVKSSRCVSTYGKKWATIFTSRGCPFNCTFCVGHAVMGRKWRPRSVENVIAEMDYLIKKYGIEHFDIEDDNFTLDKKRAKEICDAIIEKGWKIEWSTPNGIRADTVDEELIKKMKQSGCVRTIVAPESGDKWVIENLMKKNIDLKQVEQVVEWCKKYDIAIDAFFLIGMPGETRENVNQTIRYARKLRRKGIDECLFGIVVPHKGTEIYKIVVQNSWIKLKNGESELVEKLARQETFIETPSLSINEIKYLIKKANRVNSLFPFSRLKLIIQMAIKTPKRFLQLIIREIGKRLGFFEGKWGI